MDVAEARVARAEAAVKDTLLRLEAVKAEQAKNHAEAADAEL